jgi:hypothetical protein
MSIKAKWITLPNSKVRELHLDLRLFKYWGSSHGAKFDRDNLSSIESEIGPKEADLIESLHSIHGVYEVGVDRFAVRIIRGECFDWEPITEQVETALMFWLVQNERASAGEVFEFITEAPAQVAPEPAETC